MKQKKNRDNLERNIFNYFFHTAAGCQLEKHDSPPLQEAGCVDYRRILDRAGGVIQDTEKSMCGNAIEFRRRHSLVSL